MKNRSFPGISAPFLPRIPREFRRISFSDFFWVYKENCLSLRSLSGCGEICLLATTLKNAKMLKRAVLAT